MASQELDRRLLDEVEAGRGVSQRSLSRSIGVALGLTNLLLRRLARKGFIRIVKIKPNRVRYVITPAGVAAKARLTRQYLEHSIRFYAEARERVTHSFTALSAEWHGPMPGGAKPIVFYGASELAEIGYVCLQETDLTLIGVIDDQRTRPFFGLPVHGADALGAGSLDGKPFGRIVVMSLRDSEAARARLEALGCDPERIYCL